MTELIGFSPPAQSGPALPPGPPSAPPGHSAFWPLFVILLTLMFATVRDGVALQKRTNEMLSDSARPQEILERSGKQAAFVEEIRKDLVTLAPSDPKAAQILADYFPNPPAETTTAVPARTAPATNAPLPSVPSK